MRNGTILNRKFYLFLLPNILSNVALSLNEFVDSIIVSQLLGSDAMSMVNMGWPIMLLFSTTYTLLGVGGSNLYARNLGRMDREKADHVLSVSFFLALIIAITVTAAGLIFIEPVAARLCPYSDLHVQFIPYLKVLILSGILIIPLQFIIQFMPALGRPGIGTAINIIANFINIIMDYVFIRFFDTGLRGASLATLTGYLAGGLIFMVLCAFRMISFNIRPVMVKSLRDITEICTAGLSPL